jgi:flagellar assembly factor FliW
MFARCMYGIKWVNYFLNAREFKKGIIGFELVNNIIVFRIKRSGLIYSLLTKPRL